MARGIHARLFSTSATARDKDVKTNTLASPKLATSAPVLVKVGDGKWNPFKHDNLQGMDTSDLLEALAGSRMFALDFKDVKLSACTVHFGKLPADQDEPSAQDAAGFLELKGAKTVGTAAGSIAAGDQVCIRVRLPRPAGAGAAVAGARRLPITVQLCATTC